MITIEQAEELFYNRTQGVCSDISSDKGGSVWLEGQWTLAELEALCVVIRHDLKELAKGAEDFFRSKKDITEGRTTRVIRLGPVELYVGRSYSGPSGNIVTIVDKVEIESTVGATGFVYRGSNGGLYTREGKHLPFSITEIKGVLPMADLIKED